MGDERWFCRSEEEWDVIAERLKLTPCPHCDAVGQLMRHGYAYGFDENSSRRKTIRARRIFCSNRNRRRGCGRTFCVWLADKIRRLSLTTHCLWTFLQHVVGGPVGALAAAIRAADAADCRRSDRTWQRLWRRFLLGQSKIRTALLGRCPPPELPAASQTEAPKASRRSAATQVLAHLKAAFPDADCPIAAFQHSTSSFFV